LGKIGAVVPQLQAKTKGVHTIKILTADSVPCMAVSKGRVLTFQVGFVPIATVPVWGTGISIWPLRAAGPCSKPSLTGSVNMKFGFINAVPISEVM